MIIYLQGIKNLFFWGTGFICGMLTPTLQNKVDGESIEIIGKEHPLVQRAVAENKFYGFPPGWFDTVLVFKYENIYEKRCAVSIYDVGWQTYCVSFAVTERKEAFGGCKWH